MLSILLNSTLRLKPQSGYDLQPRVAASATLGSVGDISSEPQRGCANPTAARRKRKMPQSLSAVYIHLVFSTKNREPFLSDKLVRIALHAQIGGISKTLGCAPIRAGGVAAH